MKISKRSTQFQKRKSDLCANARKKNTGEKHMRSRIFFYDHYPVENVGYYKLSKEVIEEFNKRYPRDAFEAEDETESSALFYHEWY